MNFDLDVVQKSYEVPVLVMFSAEWCPPCRAVKPHLKAVADATEDWELQILNVEEYTDQALEYKVRGIPDIRLFMDGQMTKYMGYPIVIKIQQWVEEMVNPQIDFDSGI